MKKVYSFLIFVLCAASASLHAQISFTNQPALLNGTYHSGGIVGVVDMDGDGLDDIVIFDESKNVYIEYQNSNGTFTQEYYGSISGVNQWGAAVGDVNSDGHKDIYSGGKYDGVHFLSISQAGTSQLSDLDNDSMFMQCANIVDIDNDGWLDAFGCHDDEESRIWMNNQLGQLLFANVIDFTTTPISDMSGNYGSCWTDFDQDGDIDLYISKCRSGVNSNTDPRRVNVLYVNDGNGNFVDEAVARGIAVGDQSWSSDFGDIDNDGDFDLVITNHDNSVLLFENDGTGHFTDITQGSGIGVVGFFLQSIMRDFDNDGYLDLLLSGGFGSSYMFKGNGDGTFTDVTTAIQSVDELHSFGLGDLNHDGFIDYYASYGDVYVEPDFSHEDRLWLNDGNNNNWVAFELEGTTSNVDAIGATTKIYGPWGVQMREVRAGESYGINNSFIALFGLGSSTMVDSVTISWPSGVTDTYTTVVPGAYYTVVEGQGLSVNISEAFDKNELRIWPNPSSDIISVQLPKATGKGRLEVFDASGRAVFSEAISGSSASTGQLTVDLSMLSPGTFMLRFAFDEFSAVEPIVIR